MNKINFQFNLLNSIPTIIAGFLAVSLIFGTVFLWPKFQDSKTLKKNIEEKKTELKLEEQYFSKLNQTNSELEKYGRELAIINSALPDTPSVPSLFNFLQKASSQSGMVLKGISPFIVSSSEMLPQLAETKFTLEVIGSYSSFKNFISTLEKSARLIEVENISFSSSAEGELFSFNLRIKVSSY